VRQVKGRMQLWFPAVSGTVPDTPQDARSGALAVLDQHGALMERMAAIAQQERAPLLAMIDARDETIRELERENARLAAEMKRLTPPDTEPARRPWWRRMFGE
jgi:hypothetical protein